MSRIGKQSVTLPKGVKASVSGLQVAVEGPRGKLHVNVAGGINVVVEGDRVKVTASSDDTQANANWGSARALIKNMVVGVTQGWKRALEMNGVGFQANVKGKTLVLTCGFSHDVEMPIPLDVKCVINKNVIELESNDRHSVGAFAASIRRTQPPEPYLGKGIKFVEETIRRKAGKAAAKGATK